MNNNNGAISFDAYIETSDFKKQIDEMEARIVDLSGTAVNEGRKMDESFKKAGAALAAYFSFDALKGLAQNVVQVRGEFQKMEAVLTNTLGSGSAAAEAMNMIAEFGATTPFQVDEVTNSFIKLANQGFVPTKKELVKLGDLASSTGKPFDQLAEAIIDAQVGEMERLKEFGIRASKEGEKITFTFKEQSKTVDFAADSIREYLLSLGEVEGVAGSNAKIAATMAGQLSNLEDSWTSMLNEVGKSNEELLSGAISGVASLVENYETIINLLKVLVATYGTYKAAVMVTTAVHAAAAAGVGSLTAAETLHYAALVLCEKGQKILNATMLNNPYVLAATLLIGLVTSIVLFTDKTTAATKAQESLNKATEAGEKAAADEIAKIQVLTASIQSETTSRDKKRESLEKLKALSPDILGGLTEEAVKTGEAKDAIDRYVESLKRKIELETLEKELADSIKREQDAKAGKNDISIWRKMFLSGATYEQNAHGTGTTDFIAEARKEHNAELVKSEKSVQEEIKKKIALLFDEGKAADGSGKKEEKKYKSVSDRIEEIKTKIKELEKEKLSVNVEDSSKISKLNDEIKKLKEEKDKLDGSSEKESPIAGSLDYYKKIKEDAQKSLSSLSEKDADFASKQAGLLDTLAKAEKKINEIQIGQSSFADQLQDKKRQYEKYFDWVKSLGKNIADEEFASLIAEGDSYVEYVNKQIATLEAKKSAGKLSGEESDKLVTLYSEKDDASGMISGIEAFKESLQETKKEAADLVEYLGVLKKKQAELEGDNSPESVGKKAILKEEEESVSSEIQSRTDALTSQYAQGAERVKLIQAQLNSDLSVLNKAYLDAKTASEKEQIEKIIDARKKAANIETLQADVDWGAALGDTSESSTGSLERLRDKLIKIVDDASKEYSPEGLQTIIDAISRINEELTDRAPMNALLDAYGSYKDAVNEVEEAKEKIKKLDAEGKKNTDAMRSAEDDLAEAESKRSRSLADMNKAVGKLAQKGQNVVDAGNAVCGMLDDMGIKVPDSISGALGGMDKVVNSLASIDLTKPFSLVTGVTGAIGGVFKTLGSLFGGSSELSEKVFKRYENLISVLDQVIDRQKELLSGKAGSEALEQYAKGMSSITKQLEAAQKMGKDWLNSGAKKGFLGIGSKASHGKKQMDALRAYRSELAAIGINLDDLGGRATGLFDLTADQLKLIQEKAPAAWAVLDDKTKEYLQTIIDASDKMEDLENSIRETLTGISFDSAKDSLKDLILDADATLEDVSGKMGDYMRKAVASIIVDKTLQAKIEQWYKAFADAMSDDELSKEESEALQQMYNSLYNQAVELRNKAFEAAGITPEKKEEEEEESPDPLVGSVQSLTEETGSAVAGQITMMRVLQAEQLENMKESILLLSEIAANTRYCSYLAKLDRIVEILEGPTAGDNLRAKGLA